jgi:hypothetical protein
MSHPDAFALKNSGLNDFLFAEVGTELNGSSLSVLSVLARLGRDPWAEATRWTTLPKRQSIDSLVQSIVQMPLCAEALADVRATATRLIQLLPAQVDKSSSGGRSAPANKGKLAPMTVFYCALAVVMAVNMLLLPQLIGGKPTKEVPALIDTQAVPHAP